MDKALKAKLKKRLEEMRDEINSKIKQVEQDNLRKSQKEAAGDLSGYGMHMADVASDNFEREVSLGMAENERGILKQIDMALKRINDKDFGSCEKCSKDIGLKRIAALPYARLCIECQENEDKSQKRP